jgi:hypothetical protein
MNAIIYPVQPMSVGAIVPKSISMRQFRLVLDKHDLLDQVLELFKNMEGPAGRQARIELEYAATVERSNALFGLAAQAFGLSEEQIDEMFIEGSQL